MKTLTLGTLWAIDLFKRCCTPQKEKNLSSTSDFILDFNEYLELLSNEQRVFIFGDFNLHFEKDSDIFVSEYKTLLKEHDVLQSVDVSTHISGHPKYKIPGGL